MKGGMSCQLKCSFLCGMKHVNPQSNVTVHEREIYLTRDIYLERTESLFSFSFIMGVFILVVCSSSFSEGILWSFPFFNTGFPATALFSVDGRLACFSARIKRNVCRLLQHILMAPWSSGNLILPLPPFGLCLFPRPLPDLFLPIHYL